MNNTVVRTFSGLVFILIMVGSILIGPLAYATVMIFITAIIMQEYLQISLGKNYKQARVLSIVSGVLLFILFFINQAYGVTPYLILLVAIPYTGLYISILYDKNRDAYNYNQYLGGAIIYAALPFALTNLIVFKSDGSFYGNILLFFFIILWVSDVGAYIFGMLFGQKNGHKLFPSISPKKSWEGFFGGLICALIFAVIIYCTGLIDIALIHTIIIALIINLFGVLGDLAESQFKRNFGVKDSGSLMPGHGGLLDRFDGALLSFPVAVMYIKLFSLI